ncbi:histidine phosphatase family protein [Candidatus Saccharibacteria bacterium]|nr:histidine phosphatase family protein [Candidatus Saccharibacteria bacterium]
MATIHLLRHGQSQANTHPERIGGRTPHALLTADGEQQAQRAGEYMKYNQMKPSYAVVSPALRTLRTASLALGELDYHGKVKITSAVHEVSQGEVEGQLREHVYTQKKLDAIARLGKDFSHPGGESVREVGARMLAAVYAVDKQLQCNYQEHASGLIVTHETAIKALIAHVKGYSQEWVFHTRLANASLTTLQIDGTNISFDTIGVPTSDE